MNWQPLKVLAYASVDDYLEKSARRYMSLRRPEPQRKPVVEPKRAARIEYVHAFDEHVICWRQHLAKQHMTSKLYLKARCEEIGVSYDDIVGPSRSHEHVRPRQMLMWELRQRRPSMSLGQLGAEFGGRDHTTILHGMQMHERRLMGDGGTKG